jgi:predicted nucleotide-binding protein
MPEIKPAQLTKENMRAALPKLARRIEELKALDISAIRIRRPESAKAIEHKIESTLQDVLGLNTAEYNQYRVGSLDTLPITLLGETHGVHEIQQGYRVGVERALTKLKTLCEIFEEKINDDPDTSPSHRGRSGVATKDSRRVFVVHGHESGVKETVARYLNKLELEPVILHEQANQGRTVIEKFEAHADVGYAVILFTPDDVGYPKDHPEWAKSRARQNVVLELGFFLGALGRQRVCVLYSGEIEMPSDFSGVLYVPLDPSGAWQFHLAKEIKSSGIDIDLNKAM